MADKSLEEKTRELAERRNESGKEVTNYQDTQTQLSAIQAEQQKNLAEARAVSAANHQQTQLLGNAGQVLAASQGGGGGNSSNGMSAGTQQLLQKYGLNQPKVLKNQSHSQQVTKQNITINNNTTTTTTNNVQANTPPPVQRADSGGGDSTGKFKVWLNNTIARQNEENAKREKEYDKRGESLTRDANKMLRKLGEFGKDLGEKLDPRKIGGSVKSQLKSLLFIFGFQYLASNWVSILKTVGKIEKAIFKGLEWIGFDIKGPNILNWRFNLSNSKLAATFMSFITGKKWESGKVEFMDLASGFRDALLGDGKNGSKMGFLYFFKEYFESKWKEKQKAADMIEKPAIDWTDPGGALGNIVGYISQLMGVYLGDPEAAVKKNLAAQMDKKAAESARQGYHDNRNRVGHYKSYYDYGEKFGLDFDIKSGDKKAALKNTDMGDLALFDKSGNGAYGVSSRYLNGNGTLSSAPAATIAQAQEIMRNLSDAEKGQVNTSDFVANINRLRNRVEEKGKVAVPLEFINTLPVEDQRALLASGDIKKTKYYWVRKKKFDGSVYRSDGERAYESSMDMTGAEAVGVDLSANFGREFFNEDGSINWMMKGAYGVQNEDDVNKYFAQLGSKSRADRDEYYGQYDIKLLPEELIDDENDLRAAGGKGQDVYELTPNAVQTIINRLANPKTGEDINVDYTSEDFYLAMNKSLMNRRIDNQTEEQRAAGIKKWEEQQEEALEKMKKARASYENKVKTETEDFKKDIRSHQIDFESDAGYFNRKNISGDIDFTLDDLGISDISNFDFDNLDTEQFKYVKVDGKLTNIKEVLKNNPGLTAKLLNILSAGPRNSGIEWFNDKTNNSQVSYSVVDGKVVKGSKRNSSLPPDWEPVDPNNIADWVQKYLTMEPTWDDDSAHYAFAGDGAEAKEKWKVAQKWLRGVWTDYQNYVNNSDEVFKQARLNAVKASYNDHLFNTREDFDEYSAAIKNFNNINSDDYRHQVTFDLDENSFRQSNKFKEQYNQLADWNRYHTQNNIYYEALANSDNVVGGGKYLGNTVKFLNGAQDNVANLYEAGVNYATDVSKNGFKFNLPSIDSWNLGNGNYMSYIPGFGNTTSPTPTAVVVPEADNANNPASQTPNLPNAGDVVPPTRQGTNEEINEKQQKILDYYDKYWGQLPYTPGGDPKKGGADCSSMPYHAYKDCLNFDIGFNSLNQAEKPVGVIVYKSNISEDGKSGGGKIGTGPGELNPDFLRPCDIILYRIDKWVEGTKRWEECKSKDSNHGTRRWGCGHTALYAGYMKLKDKDKGDVMRYTTYSTGGYNGNKGPYTGNLMVKAENIIMVKRYIGYENATGEALTEDVLKNEPDGVEEPVGDGDDSNKSFLTKVKDYFFDMGRKLMSGELFDDIGNKAKEEYNAAKKALGLDEYKDPTFKKKSDSFRRASRSYDGPIFPEFTDYSQYLMDSGELPPGLSREDWQRTVRDYTGSFPWDLKPDAVATSKRKTSELSVDTKSVLSGYTKSPIATPESTTSNNTAADGKTNAVEITSSADNKSSVVPEVNEVTDYLMGALTGKLSESAKDAKDAKAKEQMDKMIEIANILRNDKELSEKLVALMAEVGKIQANNVDATRDIGTLLAKYSTLIIELTKKSKVAQASSTRSGSGITN